MPATRAIRGLLVLGAAVALAVSASPVATSAQSPPSAPPPAKLRFDPFEKPPLGAASGGSVRSARKADGKWAPVLRATLVAGESPLANLGGVVLAVGEETHGYRLLDVRPFGAVFSRAGERVELEVQSGDDNGAVR